MVNILAQMVALRSTQPKAMAALRSRQLSTRGLALAIHRLPAERPACRQTLALAKPVTCAVHQHQFENQRRGFLGWGRSNDGDGDGDAADKGKAAAETAVKSGKEGEAAIDASKAAPSDAQPVAAQSSGAAAAEQSAESPGEAQPAAEAGTSVLQESADSVRETGGAIVPINPAELRSDSNPPFEPRMLVLPLLQRPLFPGQHQMLQVTNPRVIEAIVKAQAVGSPVFVAAFLKKKDPAAEFHDENAAAQAEDLSGTDPLQSLYSVGTRARIVQAAPFTATGPGKGAEKIDDAAPTMQVLLHGRDLVRMEKVLDLGPPLHAQVSRVRLAGSPKEGHALDEVKAYINETMHTVREIMKINPQFREHAALIHQGMQRMEHGDPHAIAHFAACLTTADGAELMQTLEAEDPSEKLRIVLTLVKKELELSQLQQKLSTQIQEKVDSRQREFMLREQLKMIKKELGEDKSDGSDLLLEKFKKRLEGKTVPQDAQEAIDQEMEKMSGLAKESQEFQITRNYLDWLTVLPWGVHSEDTLSLRKARGILDKDHHGLADVKQRILELIAVGTLRGSVQGKIICFVGPPGVGKTSIGKSIAEALGREFYRFSVGGLYDVAEIKGHRRTYVGAMPGKVVQCLKKVRTANPLVLIDEVDKIGSGHQGDPASALLELLDPSQNSSFMDHYLDVPVDASKILFVCTANVTDTIPGPLLDRMEVIRLSGYDLQEKLKIAEDYLIPSSMREMGLWPPAATPADSSTSSEDVADAPPAATGETDKDEAHASAKATGEADKAAGEATASDGTVVVANEGGAPEARIEQGAVESLIRWYCREAGVRNLQKHVEKICRKLAMRVVEQREAAEDADTSTEEAKAEEADKSTAGGLVVTEEGLGDLVGKPPFTSDRLYEGALPPGTVTGLAWTAMGGSVLYMEASALPRHEGKAATPSLGVTGQLGDVMKESSQLALLIARRQLADLAPDSRKAFFEQNELHLHCPEGAVPKDGPSAGVTIVTALLSLGLDRPIRADLAMTGEVSLNGKVLAIGGVKEKTMAARRAGCKALVFPRANQKDFEELPSYLRDGLEVHFATDYSDVFAVAFPDHGAEAA